MGEQYTGEWENLPTDMDRLEGLAIVMGQQGESAAAKQIRWALDEIRRLTALDV